MSVLGGEQDALAEEREPGAAEHLALDHSFRAGRCVWENAGNYTIAIR
jgi:hypothetical protein